MNKVLCMIIAMNLSLFLFLIVPSFFKNDPIAYTDMNILFALFLSMTVSGVGVILCDEELGAALR